MIEIEFSLSAYLSNAAHHQALAFQYRSDQAVKRHSKLAEYWYMCARIERRFLKLPGYKPSQPIWAQADEVQDAMNQINREEGV